MIKKFTAFILGAILALACAVTVFADINPIVKISDDYGYLEADERSEITLAAEEFAQKSGFNIVICITDDIGEPKTDGQTVEYADLMYEEFCGLNTDGILLLINNDTEYDYISTSGACINYYSDYRIDLIFDSIYGYIIDRDFDRAALKFIDRIEYYYDMGKVNSQTEFAGMEVDSSDFFGMFVILVIVGGIVGVIIFFVNLKRYKLEKPSTAVYINKNSVKFGRFADVFLGNFTNRIYSPVSSGSSSGGRGSRGHSSTHRSSGGGRHGGGGRHR